MTSEDTATREEGRVGASLPDWQKSLLEYMSIPGSVPIRVDKAERNSLTERKRLCYDTSMSNCPRCGGDRTKPSETCSAVCHTIPRCHCGKAVYEGGWCYQHYQAAVSLVAGVMGAKGGKVKGPSKRRDVDYAALGALGGAAGKGTKKPRRPKGGKRKTRRKA